MATNSTAPTPAHRAPDRDAFRVAIAEPAFHVWSVAFLLGEYLKRGVTAADVYPAELEMLVGVAKLSGRLTREVARAAVGPVPAGPEFTNADFNSRVGIPASCAASIANLLGGFFDRHQDGELSVDDLGTIDGAVETLERLTREAWEGVQAVEMKLGGA